MIMVVTFLISIVLFLHRIILKHFYAPNYPNFHKNVLLILTMLIINPNFREFLYFISAKCFHFYFEDH